MRIKNSVIHFFIDHLPFTGTLYRLAIGIAHAITPKKKTYSQHLEDEYIFSELKNDLAVSNISYIDIGGNHPTRINNTYLLYRKGFTGIVIEPNKSYKYLYSLLRRKDTFLPYGCGDKCELLRFYHSKTPVLSSFIQRDGLEKSGVKLKKFDLLPVFTLDSLLNEILKETNQIAFMSIDTEGFNEKVLKGANSILQKVCSVLIEFDDEGEKARIIEYLGYFNFELDHQFGCNLFFKNKLTSSNHDSIN